LLITDAYHTPISEILTRKDRDLRLINTISERLAANGSLLIPVQTSTRILELAYTLDEHWKKHKLSFHLIFLSHQSQSTMVYAKSMLEWMGDAISQNFQSRDQPFDFRYLKCCQSLDELSSLTGPRVILASFPGLDFGLGHELLVHWASDPTNCVLFPERPPAESLGGLLYDAWLNNNMTPTQMNQDLNMQVKF
jgi:cleavage and polyadenylation specificity factor subunit 2